MDMTTAAAISPIPTLQDYVASGGKPEEYNAYVDKRKAELEEGAMEAARAQAKKTVRFRVVGTGWRAGQTHYKVLAKAPFDSRLKPGEPGYENPYKPEPPLSLRIGAVTEVPIRDERHLKMLLTDVNLKPEDDDVLTHEEEQALVNAARTQALSGATSDVVTLQASAVEAFKRELVEVKERAERNASVLQAEADGLRKRVAELEAKGVGTPVDLSKMTEEAALRAVEATGDVLVLLGWLKDADTRGVKALSAAVEAQLDVLGDLVGEAFKARQPKPEEKPSQQGKSKGK